MTEQSCMNDAANGHASGNAFLKSFRIVLSANQTRQPCQELRQIHAGTVEIRQTLKEHSRGQYETAEKKPNERSTF